jgi:hypothetical protein
MWTTLGLIAALSLAPGQTSSGLNLTNIRSTYGLLGATRSENKLLPGDAYFVAFDIEGVKTSDSGEVSYSMGMELADGNKKVWYKQEPQQLKALNSLGGNRLPAFAHVNIGVDQPAGRYTLTVTVTDLAAKASKSFNREFEVLPHAFGLVRVNLSAGAQGVPPAPFIELAGQSIWVNFTAVGFGVDAKKAPDLSVEMAVLDENNKPTLAKPMVGAAKEKEAVLEGTAVPMQFFLALNRPGSFTVKLKATDNISKKTSEVAIPVKVLEAK